MDEYLRCFNLIQMLLFHLGKGGSTCSLGSIALNWCL